ncbi:MAG TPA: hypothetical protein VI299_14030 [Polyangiales bacterium]
MERASGGATGAASAHRHEHAHIHCIACGKHLDPNAFGDPGGPAFYRCQHGSDFPHCAEHAARAKELVDEHDRSGKPVQQAAAWH